MALSDTEFYVYLWLRSDGTPYYVGKGSRRRAHYDWWRESSCRPPKDKSHIVIIPRSSEAEAFKTEIELIRNWGRKDLGLGCLRNLTNGGPGCPARVVSAETRRKISEIQKIAAKLRWARRKASGEVLFTPEHRANLSAAGKGKAQRGTGWHHSEETKRKISETERKTKSVRPQN